jgi:Lon protease-like protein
MTVTVPLFPLNSIVLPGGRIPLQLFEPRYIDMLTRCLKDDEGFVVVLLREGAEAGSMASFYEVGTYVRIIDFQQLENGLLGITVEGESKVAVLRSWREPC